MNDQTALSDTELRFLTAPTTTDGGRTGTATTSAAVLPMCSPTSYGLGGRGSVGLGAHRQRAQDPPSRSRPQPYDLDRGGARISRWIS